MSTYPTLRTIVDIIKPVRYLEVGVATGSNLSAVSASYKAGIDPRPMVPNNFPHKIYCGPSDEVFGSDEFKECEKSGFDLIFIDGLHEARQVIRDIVNSLRFLRNGGIIVCHDVYPYNRLMLPGYERLIDTKNIPTFIDFPWCGDVWKVPFILHNLEMRVNYFIVTEFPGYLCLWPSIAKLNYLEMPKTIEEAEQILKHGDRLVNTNNKIGNRLNHPSLTRAP